MSLALSGQVLLSGIDIVVEAGEVVCLMGPSGAGKSLLLRLLAGLLPPTSGEVLWGRAAPARERTQRLALVFQKPILLRRSALENVLHPLEVMGVPAAERREWARAELERAGLSLLAGRPARTLSGGEQQRLSLARALAMRPDVLLLDEPTSNLDPASTARIEALIRESREAGRAALLVTHEVGQARRLADRIVLLHRGRIVEQGSARQILERPASAEARAFLAGELLV